MSQPHVAMFGGHFTFVQDWAKAAVAAGAEVTLLDEIRGRASGDTPEGTCGYSVRHYSRLRRLRPSRYFWPLNDCRNERTIRRLIVELGVENRSVSHLHTHFYPGSHVVARVARDLQIPLVHTEHSSAIVTGRVSRRGRLALLETSEEAVAFFAVSEQLADALRDLGVDRPIRVVPNPVDLALFASVSHTARYPPEGGIWHFVTIGWLLPAKAQSQIIEAFALVKRKLPGSMLSIIGDGVLRAELEDVSASLNLADSVRFLGRTQRREIAEILGASHCYVHASRSETFGVSLVEAWAAGLPVVTYACGGVSGLANSIGGQVVGSRDAVSLAEAMLEAISVASLASRDDIRSRASEYFGLDHAVRALSEAYGADAYR